MEEGYGFDLVLKYKNCWHFFDYDGNPCQCEDCCFYDPDFVLGLCPTQRPTVRLL